MPTFDAAFVRQAIRRDATISTVGPRSTSAVALQEYAWKQRPLDLMRLVQQTARPWPEVPAKLLGSMPDSGVERLFARLRADDEDCEQDASCKNGP